MNRPTLVRSAAAFAGVNRRTLVRGAAGTAVLTAASYNRVPGANDRVRAGMIGLGSRGSNALIPCTLELGIPIAAVCDVYKPQIDRALSAIHAHKGSGAAGTADNYTDYRKMLERRDIDVVFIATPEHWHSRMTVDACQAGKDVYVEKPLAHSVEECLAVVDAAARYQRIVQVGLQQRSMKIYHDALAMIRSGVIGNVRRCEMAWGFGGDDAQPADPATNPPDGLDWELFQGPAPRHPYQASRHKGWHGYWDYGHGQITDVGVHVMDVARWFLDLDMPLSVYAASCDYPPRPPERVPEAVDAVWKFERALVTYSSRREDMLNRFWGQRGWIALDRLTIRTAMFGKPYQPVEVKETPVMDPGYENTTLKKFNIGNIVHVKNFLECVHSRRKPNCDPEKGAKSTIANLMAARTVRTGKPCTWAGAQVKDL